MSVTDSRNKKNKNRNLLKEDSSLKKYLVQRLEKLSWKMGKKEYTKRVELYDR